MLAGIKLFRAHCPAVSLTFHLSTIFVIYVLRQYTTPVICPYYWLMLEVNIVVNHVATISILTSRSLSVSVLRGCCN